MASVTVGPGCMAIPVLEPTIIGRTLVNLPVLMTSLFSSELVSKCKMIIGLYFWCLEMCRRDIVGAGKLFTKIMFYYCHVAVRCSAEC